MNSIDPCGKYEMTRAVRVKQGALNVSRKNIREKLVSSLTPVVFERFQQLWVEAHMEGDDEFFAELMGEIPSWGAEAPEALEAECEVLTDEVPRLVTYLHLIVVSHVMSAATLRFGEQPEQVSVDLPDALAFTQYLYALCARVFEANPDLLSTNLGRIEAKKAYATAEDLIAACIRRAIDRTVPTDQIIDDYLIDLLKKGDSSSSSSSSSSDEEEEEEDGPPPLPPMPEDPLQYEITSDDVAPPVEERKKVVLKREAWDKPTTVPRQDDLMAGIDDGEL